MADAQPPVSLADLRRDIDRIDAEMHGLLMERGTIIDRLIAVKKTQATGSAFRPGRESSMMRTLAERHAGILPFDTVESIWRVIISTFTYVQAPYSVHADISIGDAQMRDTARFHFGFTVPYLTHQGADAVINAVASSAGDLGIFPAEPSAKSGFWWRGLIGPDTPKIIARLPFVERPDHPAGTPVYVISKPIEDAAIRETLLFALHTHHWSDTATKALAALGATIEAQAEDAAGTALLLSCPETVSTATLIGSLTPLEITVHSCDEIGSHANRFQWASATPSLE